MVRVAHQVRLQPIRIVEPSDEPRDLFTRSRRYWNGRPVDCDADPEFQATPSGGAGHTIFGTPGPGRDAFCGPSESAIYAALRWLGRHQNADGGWAADVLNCPCGDTWADSSSKEEVTALVLHAFITARFAEGMPIVLADANGEVHLGEAVEKGMGWLSRRDGWVADNTIIDEAPDPGLPEELLLTQAAGFGCDDGSWEAGNEGRVLRTVLNVLRLIEARNRYAASATAAGAGAGTISSIASSSRSR